MAAGQTEMKLLLALIVCVPAIPELALRWDWLHELEHACFFATGHLFIWWPMAQPGPATERWPRWLIHLLTRQAHLCRIGIFRLQTE
jgi:cytochrome c oxidase assembly factor CtaG